MKPTSKQNARVGRIRKVSNFKLPNINAMINSLENASTGARSKHSTNHI
ncbi:hypothetical protein ACFFVB_17935 [Formosa undariae]|uniref:Uncharacterized protein n=1 Tax=Formosa undariae TaxID=1325436 RepID=A0ABV5F682_9FLAO